MMDVDQNMSSESMQVLAVFDGLLPMVCWSFFIQLYHILHLLVFDFKMNIFWHVTLLVFNIFQESEGDFKPDINPSYIPNDMKGNLTYRCSNRSFGDSCCDSLALIIVVKYFRSL